MLEYSFVPFGKGGDCIDLKYLAYKQQPQVAAFHFLLEISSFLNNSCTVNFLFSYEASPAIIINIRS